MLNKFTDIQVGGTVNTKEDQNIISMGWIIQDWNNRNGMQCNTVLLFDNEIP